MDLVVGQSYLLEGMTPEMWDAGHPVYGTPRAVAARYLGALMGTRRWHGFEIRLNGRDEGVMFMTDTDLDQLTVRPL